MERDCFGSGGEGLEKWAVKLLSHSGWVYLQVICCDWHWFVHDCKASKYDRRGFLDFPS
jgi:hypothetical protein